MESGVLPSKILLAEDPYSSLFSDIQYKRRLLEFLHQLRQQFRVDFDDAFQVQMGRVLRELLLVTDDGMLRPH